MKQVLQIILISIFLSTNAFSTTHQIQAGMMFYQPSSLTINVGDTVVWVNSGGTHNVNGEINSITGESFENPESFNSNLTSEQGATIYTHIFNFPGTYNYDCSVGTHAIQGMTGSITVEGTVVDVIINSASHNTLELALTTAGLTNDLNGAGPFTVFAPTDDAFAELPDGALEELLENIPILSNILLHHVHGELAMSTDLSDGMSVSTLNEDELTVTIDGTSVMIDMANVITPDIVADNGVIHVIDMVLVPEDNVDYTVMDIIEVSNNHQILEDAILSADLDETLSGEGPFTIFAPTDGAFDMLPSDLLEGVLANEQILSTILLHHVHQGNVLAENLSDGMEVPTMNEDTLIVTIEDTTVMIDMSTVIVTDLIADNGVVHVIDMVLIPSIDTTFTVMDIIENSPFHTTLNTAIVTAGLDNTLSGDGPFTVFAPTNDAFEELDEGTVEALLNDIPQLTSILLHHVHQGNVLAQNLSDGMEVPTMNDDILTISIDGSTVMVDMSTVTTADLLADNGVVHVIDMVLLPESDPTSLEIFNINKTSEYMYSINLLGEKIDRDTKGIILFDIFSNGKTIKRYNLAK